MDVIWSAIGAALAWAIYDYTGKPVLSFIFLIALCVFYVWVRARGDKKSQDVQES